MPRKRKIGIDISDRTAAHLCARGGFPCGITREAADRMEEEQEKEEPDPMDDSGYLENLEDLPSKVGEIPPADSDLSFPCGSFDPHIHLILCDDVICRIQHTSFISGQQETDRQEKAYVIKYFPWNAPLIHAEYGQQP